MDVWVERGPGSRGEFRFVAESGCQADHVCIVHLAIMLLRRMQTIV